MYSEQISLKIIIVVLPFSFITATNQFNKPPRVADDFSSPKMALKGEKFVLECIVYGK